MLWREYEWENLQCTIVYVKTPIRNLKRFDPLDFLDVPILIYVSCVQILDFKFEKQLQKPIFNFLKGRF